MTKIPRTKRILAIDPGLKEFGFALFEEKTLIRYGVGRLRADASPYSRFAKAKNALQSIILKSDPHVLVLEKLTHPQRKKNKQLNALMSHVKSWAKVRGIRVYEFDPEKARERLLAESKLTKKGAAELIASKYPELSEYVPTKTRILWAYKDHYWLNVFDACALALAYLGGRKAKTL